MPYGERDRDRDVVWEGDRERDEEGCLLLVGAGRRGGGVYDLERPLRTDLGEEVFLLRLAGRGGGEGERDADAYLLCDLGWRGGGDCEGELILRLAWRGGLLDVERGPCLACRGGVREADLV